MDTLSGSTVFTTLDTTSGYLQIALNPEDHKKLHLLIIKPFMNL